MIRNAVVDDVKAIQKVASESWLDTYGGFYEESEVNEFINTTYAYENLLQSVMESENASDHHFFVAERGGEIVGIMEIIKREVGWEILRLYILPEYQRQGIASSLLKEAHAAIDNGTLRVCVEVRNQRGISFYKQAGFHETKRKKDHFFVLTGELLVLEKETKGIA